MWRAKVDILHCFAKRKRARHRYLQALFLSRVSWRRQVLRRLRAPAVPRQRFAGCARRGRQTERAFDRSSDGCQCGWAFDWRFRRQAERVDLRLALRAADRARRSSTRAPIGRPERIHLRLALQTADGAQTHSTRAPAAGRAHRPSTRAPSRRQPAAVSRAHYFCCICCRRAVNPSTTSGSL
jgi:hypothetical protein